MAALWSITLNEELWHLHLSSNFSEIVDQACLPRKTFCFANVMSPVSIQLQWAHQSKPIQNSHTPFIEPSRGKMWGEHYSNILSFHRLQTMCKRFYICKKFNFSSPWYIHHQTFLLFSGCTMLMVRVSEQTEEFFFWNQFTTLIDSAV